MRVWWEDREGEMEVREGMAKRRGKGVVGK